MIIAWPSTSNNYNSNYVEMLKHLIPNHLFTLLSYYSQFRCFNWPRDDEFTAFMFQDMLSSEITSQPHLATSYS